MGDGHSLFTGSNSFSNYDSHPIAVVGKIVPLSLPSSWESQSSGFFHINTNIAPNVGNFLDFPIKIPGKRSWIPQSEGVASSPTNTDPGFVAGGMHSGNQLPAGIEPAIARVRRSCGRYEPGETFWINCNVCSFNGRCERTCSNMKCQDK